jgi:hypothetical protein
MGSERIRAHIHTTFSPNLAVKISALSLEQLWNTSLHGQIRVALAQKFNAVHRCNLKE